MENDNLRNIYDTLGRDLIAILGRSKTLPQFKRRSFVRALVALIEFDIHNRKQRLSKLHTEDFIQLTNSELSLVLEIQPEIDETGKVKDRQKFLRLLSNYRFSIRLFCKHMNLQFSLNTNSSGWTSFKKLIDIRNKITHPKKSGDINITDEQFQDVLEAYKWFMDNYKSIVKLLVQKENVYIDI